MLTLYKTHKDGNNDDGGDKKYQYNHSKWKKYLRQSNCTQMQCHFCMHFNAMAKDQILNIFSIRMKTKHTSFTKLIVLLAAIPILILIFLIFP